MVARSLPASISRNTKLSGGAKPTLGSETRVAPRETAQTCNIRHQGGHGSRSYASIPRGLRCEPWSGRAEDIGMNGDNRLHLGVICRQSVEEADCLGCMCERCAPGSESAPLLLGALGGPARHAVAPWERVTRASFALRADFEARRRWSMNGADLRALEVFGEWSTTEKAVVQDPGGDF